MSSEVQLESVQQQIADVGRAVSDLEASVAGAEQAGDDRKVEFLRDRLKTMDKKEVALREEKNLLLRAQQNGGYCSLLPPLASLLAGGHSAGLHHTSLEI